MKTLKKNKLAALVVAIATKKPLFIMSVVFVTIVAPINHFFLKDNPNNPLEIALEFAIFHITGVQVDLNPQN